MYPILFSFCGIEIRGYGFFAAVAFVSAVVYVSQRIKKSNEQIMTVDQFYSFFAFLILFAIVGARVLYILTDIKYYISHPLKIFYIWEGGIVYYGGFIAGTIFTIFYAKFRKINILKFADILAPAIALGHFFGRIGCFFAGCCYGKSSNLPCAVVFSNPNTIAIRGVPLHPAQLYEAFANIALFFYLNWLLKKENKDGKVFAVYLIVYSVIRFAVEFFRGDDRGIYFLGVSIGQIISIVVFSAGLFIFTRVESARKNNL
jgi:phosphatidylglycerol:prolipoprotein diacylglycerol transferase